MKILFMGTPDYADYILKGLIKTHDVTAVVTRVDKRSGRGKKVKFPPVKETALANDIPVYQFEKLGDEFEEVIKLHKPDVAVVVAYGKIIPKKYLELTKYGFINVHASILPNLRGAAPIHYAILEGLAETGVSIMKMNEGLDTGDVYKISKLTITDDMTTGVLHDRLMELGLKTLEEVLSADDLNDLTLTPQPVDGTYAHKITKEMALIDWNSTKREISLLVRGLCPYPAAYTYLDEKRLKIFEILDYSSDIHEVGKIVKIEKDGFVVSCKDGLLKVTELQLTGKKRMRTADFLRGYDLQEGSILC